MSDLIELVIQSLSDDVRWQGNLIDGERRQCMAWAKRRLTGALDRETAYVRGVLSTLNQLMERDPLDRDDVIRAILGE
jgi:hypothetical protein